MTTQLEAMKQALEALGEAMSYMEAPTQVQPYVQTSCAITALRTAIEQMEKVEPTHCMCSSCKDGTLHDSDCSVHNEPAYRNAPCDCSVITPVAWMSPGKERLEFSTKSTVYGSHTIPLYFNPPSAEIEELRKDAAIGRVVWKFIDRMDDVDDCDPANKILAEFVAAVMPHIDAAMQEKQP